jgi:hypothetical protein
MRSAGIAERARQGLRAFHHELGQVSPGIDLRDMDGRPDLLRLVRGLLQGEFGTPRRTGRCVQRGEEDQSREGGRVHDSSGNPVGSTGRRMVARLPHTVDALRELVVLDKDQVRAAGPAAGVDRGAEVDGADPRAVPGAAPV